MKMPNPIDLENRIRSRYSLLLMATLSITEDLSEFSTYMNTKMDMRTDKLYEIVAKINAMTPVIEEYNNLVGLRNNYN